LRRAPEDPFEDILPVLHHLRARAPAFGPDLQLAQAGEHGLHRLVGIDEELAAAHAHEAPAEPLENGLPRHVLAELLDGCRLVATLKRCLIIGSLRRRSCFSSALSTTERNITSRSSPWNCAALPHSTRRDSYSAGGR